MTQTGLKTLLLFTSVMTLTACASTEKGVKSAAFKPTKSSVSSSQMALAPVVDYGASAGYGGGGVHTILSGDTIDSIAWQYKLDAADIMRMNGIVPPVRLVAGMRLQLPPPETYRVKNGDNLQLIARTFSVSQRDLVALNNITAPYQLNVGQNLRLPRLMPVQERSTSNNVVATTIIPDANVGVVAEALPSVIKETEVAGGGMMAVPMRKPDIQPVSFPASEVQETALPSRGDGLFLKPVNGSIISKFGPKSGGLYNEGINIAAIRGTPVRAADAGRVVYVGNAVDGYGNLVLIKHEGGYITAYAHMDKTFAKEGQIVKRGHTIGTVGATGSVDRAQLHFEIRKGRDSVDPMTMI